MRPLNDIQRQKVHKSRLGPLLWPISGPNPAEVTLHGEHIALTNRMWNHTAWHKTTQPYKQDCHSAASTKLLSNSANTHRQWNTWPDFSQCLSVSCLMWCWNSRLPPAVCEQCVSHSLCTQRDRQTEAGIDKAAALDTPSFISPVASHLAGLTDN